MNLFLISILTLLLSFNNEESPITLKTHRDLRQGTFKLINEGNNIYTITRSKGKQIEKIGKSGMVSQADIVWLDNYTYILFNQEIVKGGNVQPSGVFFDTLYNEVVQIHGDTHTVISYVKGIDFKVETTLKKVK